MRIMDIKSIPEFPSYYCTNEGVILDKFFRPVKEYCSEEPEFYPPWKVPKKKKKINPYKMIYLKRNDKGFLRSVHTIVAKTWVPNPRPDIFTICDHIDRNEHNNHPSNLRWVNTSLNCKNKTGMNAYFVKFIKKRKKWIPKNKWQSRVMVDGIKNYLGYYKTFREAYLVSKKFKQENFEHNYKYAVNESPRASKYLFLDE